MVSALHLWVKTIWIYQCLTLHILHQGYSSDYFILVTSLCTQFWIEPTHCSAIYDIVSVKSAYDLLIVFSSFRKPVAILLSIKIASYIIKQIKLHLPHFFY